MLRVARALGISVFLLVDLARADAPETLVRLAWLRGDGAHTCPDLPALKARVRERLGRDPFDDDAPLAIQGTVVREGDVWQAALRIHDDSGVLIGSRKLDTKAPDCSPLTEAVVLAIALTIDPEAASRPEGSSSAAFPAPTTAPAPPPAPPTSPAPVLASPEVAADVPITADPAPDARDATSLELVARGGIALGVLPKPAPLVAVAGSYGSEGLRATLALKWLPQQTTDDGRFAFGLTSGTAGACLGRKIAGDVGARLCAELELGALHAVVRDVENLIPLDAGAHFWFAGAAGPQLSWRPATALRLEAGVLAVVPISRKAFVIRDTSEVVFESDVVSAIAYVGIGIGVP